MRRLGLKPRLPSFPHFQSNTVSAVCSQPYTESSTLLLSVYPSSPQYLPFRSSLQLPRLSDLPSSFGAQRFWEISPLPKTLPIYVFKRHFSVGWRKSKLGLFLKRTEAVEKVYKLLSERVWDADTPGALSRLGVRICVYVASEVLRFPLEVNTAVNFFNWLKAKDGFDPDSYVYNALLLRLGKAGRWDEMEALAAECESQGKATCATFTSILSCYKRAGNIEEARRTWSHMEEIGIRPTTITYTTMIDLFAKMKVYAAAADCYREMVQQKAFPNVRTCTMLIRHLLAAGKLEAAVTIFQEMVAVRVKPNPITYVAVMTGYADAGDIDSVLKVARVFKDHGHRPRPLGITFAPVLKSLLGTGRIQDAERIMIEIWPESSPDERREKLVELKKASERDASYRNRCGSVDSAVTESDSDSDYEEDDSSGDVQQCKEYTRSIWNIAAFVRCLVPWRAVTIECLENAKVKWDGYLVSETLKRLRRPAVAWKFFKWVREQSDFNHDNFTYSRMIQIFLGAGKFASVRHLLEEVQKKGLTLRLHVYNKIMKYCGINREAEIALEVFDLLHKAGLKPDESTYKYLVIALYKCNRYWRAATILGEMRRAGLHPDVEIYALVMSGFGQAGDLKMVMAYYKRMRASYIKPNEHVYGAYIRAFCKSGNLDAARRLFSRMRRAGITPSRETYNVMIEVFRGADKIDVVQKLEDERKKAVVTRPSRRKADSEKFLSFHTIFVQSLVGSDISRSVAVG